MAASLGGVDVLVFSGGVGEHSVAVRQRTADRLSLFGVAVDPDCNRAAGPDHSIAVGGGLVETFVIAAREDLQIAEEARATLALG